MQAAVAIEVQAARRGEVFVRATRQFLRRPSRRVRRQPLGRVAAEHHASQTSLHPVGREAGRGAGFQQYVDALYRHDFAMPFVRADANTVKPAAFNSATGCATSCDVTQKALVSVEAEKGRGRKPRWVRCRTAS